MDISKNYTVKDVENREGHAELIGGEIVITNYTTPTHNLVRGEIAYALESFIRANNGPCVVFTENVALYVNELCKDNESYFLPDVMVVCEPDSFDKKGVHKTPKFIAEITSEETRIIDYNFKLDTYKKIGVEEYWVVDLQRNLVYKYLKSEDYIPQTFIKPQKLEISTYEGVYVDLSKFMS